MTNFMAAGQKITKLWSFYVLYVFGIFGIKKVEISKQKKISKCYFIIKLCMFMTNFIFQVKKLPSYGCFLFWVFFSYFVTIKKLKFQKKYFLKVTLELGFARSWQISIFQVKKLSSYGRFLFCVFFAFLVLKKSKLKKSIF